MRRKSARTRRRAIPQQSLPNPVGVSAFHGVLDAIEGEAARCGLDGDASRAMRFVFGMLLGVAREGRDLTITLDGADTVRIRKADMQHVAMESLADLTRLEIARAIKDKMEKKK
jgi:hypothetical protein